MTDGVFPQFTTPCPSLASDTPFHFKLTSHATWSLAYITVFSVFLVSIICYL